MKYLMKSKKQKGNFLSYIYSFMFVAITSLNTIICGNEEVKNTSNTIFDISKDQALTGISKISVFSYVSAGIIIVIALVLSLFTKEGKKIAENVRWIITVIVVLIIIGLAADGKIYSTLDWLGNILGISWK